MTDASFCLAFAPELPDGSGGDSGGPVLCHGDGSRQPLDVRAWNAEADPVERGLLARLDGPVLDIGCGPGRLVRALSEISIPALGVDQSPSAVALANRRRAPALRRSVFDPLPGTGRWGAALLFDGNIGIGGDPERLLRRVAELLAPAGRAVVEADGPDAGLRRYPARVERHGQRTEWFPWASVGLAGLAALARGTGFEIDDVVADGGRWFAGLRKSS